MRVLVVEDDVPLSTILERGLSEDGYAVDLAHRVLDARHDVQTIKYDVVVLDLGLPDGNGLDLCQELRADGYAVPILMLTARDSLSDKVSGLDSGADDYLTKPFDYPELAARLRALVRRPAESRSPVLEVGELKLDPATRRVWAGAIVVPLTTREFSLLEYLMIRATEVVSRTDLLEHVWDANYDGLSNVVDVHIANLRRKLAGPGGANASERATIETVRGAGYRLSTIAESGAEA